MSENYQTRQQRREKQKKEPKSAKKKKSKFGTFLKVFVLTMLILFLLGLIGGGATFAYFAHSAPALDPEKLKTSISTKIYDSNDKMIKEIGADKREYVTYDKIPDQVKEAFLATEDDRFYKHHGIDPIRILGAVKANLTRGFGAEGGSTITQQVIKMSYNSPQKTIKRKAQEAWLAIQLEKQYSKNEIFEMYVNKIYMSGGVSGVKTAAEYYYNKPLSKLTLTQTALLAGIQQSPNNYNPFLHPDLAEKRKNVVLSLMLQHHKISQAEYEKAVKVPVTKGLKKQKDSETSEMQYDAFLDEVYDEVKDMGYDIGKDGIKVYTTMDSSLQKYTENILNTNAAAQYPDSKFQAGITLLNTQNGEILALGGSRNPKVQLGTNYATLAQRQPGSTIKPILDYGPAIEYNKWSTYHILDDSAYNYHDRDNTPLHDWDNRYMGEMTARKALYMSRNIPAVKALNAVGLDKANQFASGLGFNFENLVESSGIGGGLATSPLQMAGAYAAFGNNGEYTKPHAIRKIVLSDNETVVKPSNIKSKKAMNDYTAYMITDMLKDVLTNPQGTGHTYANIPGLPVAGKSGTTNYSDADKRRYGIPTNAVPDSWFTGYTTNFTVSVWTGYSTQKYYIEPGYNQHISQLLFKSLMAKASENKQTSDFDMPSDVVRLPVELGSDPAKKPSKFTPSNKIVHELFVRGSEEPSAVSKQYQKLSAPKNLKASYDKKANKINISWKAPKSEANSLQYEVSANGSTLTTTSDKSYSIDSPNKGSNYTIHVIAKSDSLSSAAASVTVAIPDDEKKEKPDETAAKDDKKAEEQKKDQSSNDKKQDNASNNKKDDKSDNSNANEKANNSNNSNNGNNDNDNGNKDKSDNNKDTKKDTESNTEKQNTDTSATDSKEKNDTSNTDKDTAATDAKKDDQPSKDKDN